MRGTSFLFSLKISKKSVPQIYKYVFFSKMSKVKVHFINFMGFLAVLRTQGCFQWLSSPICSGGMADHRNQSIDCSPSGPERVESKNATQLFSTCLVWTLLTWSTYTRFPQCTINKTHKKMPSFAKTFTWVSYLSTHTNQWCARVIFVELESQALRVRVI